MLGAVRAQGKHSEAVSSQIMISYSIFTLPGWPSSFGSVISVFEAAVAHRHSFISMLSMMVPDALGNIATRLESQKIAGIENLRLYT
jgi:hypothetical protein